MEAIAKSEKSKTENHMEKHLASRARFIRHRMTNMTYRNKKEGVIWTAAETFEKHIF